MLALAELSVVPLVVLFKVFLVFVNLVFIWRKSKRKETKEQVATTARARRSHTVSIKHN